jgi:hypothetical protein
MNVDVDPFAGNPGDDCADGRMGTMMTWSVSAVLLMPLMVAVALVAAPAAAQDVQGEQELTERGQKIDQAADRAAAGRVTARIVDEWKGTGFKFTANGTPRLLTAPDVQTMRSRGLGYGEISILLALAAKQPDPTTAKSLNEIYRMRQASEGWGKIAQALGYKNLGSVIKSVAANEKAVDGVARGQEERLEKTARGEKAEKPEPIGRIERPEWPGR